MVQEEHQEQNVIGFSDYSIGRAVRRLMDESSLTEADLCRGVNLPQTTINRLLSGQTSDPRISTLTAIARFFRVTTEQLLGAEPLVASSSPKKKGLDLPILPWDQIAMWVEKYPNIESLSNNCIIEWAKTEKLFAKSSFAVWTQPSMEAFFGRKSLLLVDTKVQSDPYTLLEDGCIAFAVLDKKAPALRQVVKEGKDIFLKRLFSPHEMFLLEDLAAIKGIVVEGRQCWANTYP